MAVQCTQINWFSDSATNGCNPLPKMQRTQTVRDREKMEGAAQPEQGSGARVIACAGSSSFREKLERAKGFEPSTPTLARLCSTPELHPLNPHRSGVVGGPWAAALRRRALYGPTDFQMQQGNDGKAKKNSQGFGERLSQTPRFPRKRGCGEHCKTRCADLIRAPHLFLPAQNGRRDDRSQAENTETIFLPFSTASASPIRRNIMRRSSPWPNRCRCATRCRAATQRTFS